MVKKAQGWILALGTAGIAASGALFGAQLKAEKEALPVVEAEVRKVALVHAEDTTAATVANIIVQAEPVAKAKKQPSTPSMTAQHIASLEAQRSQLMSQRHTVEKKLAALQEKMATNAEKEKRRVVGQEILDKK